MAVTKAGMEDAVNQIVLLNAAQPVATVVVGLVTVLLFILPAIRRLRKVERFAQAVADGDLRAEALTASSLREIDSLIQSANSLQTGLRSVTQQILRSAAATRDASQELGEVADGAA